MDTWKLIAMAPPLIIWAGLFFYLKSVEKRVAEAEKRLDGLSKK